MTELGLLAQASQDRAAGTGTGDPPTTPYRNNTRPVSGLMPSAPSR